MLSFAPLYSLMAQAMTEYKATELSHLNISLCVSETFLFPM